MILNKLSIKVPFKNLENIKSKNITVKKDPPMNDSNLSKVLCIHSWCVSMASVSHWSDTHGFAFHFTSPGTQSCSFFGFLFFSFFFFFFSFFSWWTWEYFPKVSYDIYIDVIFRRHENASKKERKKILKESTIFLYNVWSLKKNKVAMFIRFHRCKKQAKMKEKKNILRELIRLC